MITSFREQLMTAMVRMTHCDEENPVTHLELKGLHLTATLRLDIF
jgi:hypothetical protein